MNRLIVEMLKNIKEFTVWLLSSLAVVAMLFVVLFWLMTLFGLVLLAMPVDTFPMWGKIGVVIIDIVILAIYSSDTMKEKE